MKEYKMDIILMQKTERIKELLDIPCEKRTEKMLLDVIRINVIYKRF